MDPDPHGELYPLLLLQASIQCPDGLHDAQPGPDGSGGIVLMCLRIAKIDQEAIAEILCNMALKVPDDLRTRGLIGTHDLTQIFRIKPPSQSRGVNQIAEQDSELTAFSL